MIIFRDGRVADLKNCWHEILTVHVVMRQPISEICADIIPKLAVYRKREVKPRDELFGVNVMRNYFG